MFVGSLAFEDGGGLARRGMNAVLVVEFLTEGGDLGVDVADEDVLRGPQCLPVVLDGQLRGVLAQAAIGDRLGMVANSAGSSTQT